MTRRRGACTLTPRGATAVDIARTGSVEAAVILVDQLVEQGAASLERVRAHAEAGIRAPADRPGANGGSPRRPDWTGSPQEKRGCDCSSIGRRCLGRSPSSEYPRRRPTSRTGRLRLARREGRRRVRGDVARRHAPAGGRRQATPQPAHGRRARAVTQPTCITRSGSSPPSRPRSAADECRLVVVSCVLRRRQPDNGRPEPRIRTGRRGGRRAWSPTGSR